MAAFRWINGGISFFVKKGNMEALQKRYYTKEEYFDLVKESQEKLEYHDGEIFAMAGGTPNHNLIAVKTLRAIDEQLDNRDCLVYNSDQAVNIESANRYLYPDISALCGEQEFEGVRLKNPVLIIEVLSEGTEAYDRGDKFNYYRSLPSFREYVLISSEKVQVESFYREEENLWRISSARELEQSIHLYSLDLDIPLSRIYAKVSFDESE